MKRTMIGLGLAALLAIAPCFAQTASLLAEGISEDVSSDAPVLTAENCEDLAAMLSGEYPHEERMKKFAADYSGQVIAIDGFIVDADIGLWRDIKISAGSYEDAAGKRGPYFLLTRMQPQDFGLEGTEFPDYIKDRSHVHLVGRVTKYDDWDDGIALELVSIEPWNPLLDGLDLSAYTTLKKGSEGEEVRALQQRLIELLYLQDKADGVYGSNTKKAVERFQAAINAEVNGIADPATQAILFSDKAPERKLSIACSTITVGSSSTTVWSVDGQEFTLKGSSTKTIKTIWGTYKFDAYGKYVQVD